MQKMITKVPDNTNVVSRHMTKAIQLAEKGSLKRDESKMELERMQKLSPNHFRIRKATYDNQGIYMPEMPDSGYNSLQVKYSLRKKVDQSK